MKDKYLRKDEFRYNSNPEIKNPRGEGHVAYVTVRHKKNSKINIITHADNFYGEPTTKLSVNPERSPKTKSQKKPSRFSVPRWEKNSFLKDPPKGFWKMSKKDRKAIRKANKKYAKRKKK